MALSASSIAYSQNSQPVAASASLEDFSKQMAAVGFDKVFSADQAKLLKEFKSKEGERNLEIRADESKVLELSKSKEPLAHPCIELRSQKQNWRGKYVYEEDVGNSRPRLRSKVRKISTSFRLPNNRTKMVSQPSAQQ